MGAALASSRRFVAASYPRDRFGARIAVGTANAYCRIRNVDFRAFVHSPKAIEDVARQAGFGVAFSDRDFIWHGVVFERA